MEEEKGGAVVSVKETNGDVVTIKEKTAYAGGMLCNQFGEAGIYSLANNVYNLVLGISPATISMVLGAIRLWDAITDSLVGTISDNSKNPKGRRKPFLFLGAILMSVTYPLIWFAAPDWSDHAKAIYFFCMAIIFFTCYTIYSVAYRALGFELTPDYRERTTISIFTSVATKVYMLAIVWIYPLSQVDGLFEDEVTGIRILTGSCSLIILVAGITCSIVPQERYHKVAKKQEKVPFWSSFKVLIKDRSFVSIHGIGLGLLWSGMLVQSLGGYINIFYVWEGNRELGSRYSAIAENMGHVLGFVLLILMKKFLMNVDKKRLISWVIYIALIGSGLKWFVYDPERPYLIFILPFFFAPIYTGLWTVFMSLLGDFCDYDEHKHGKRREGMFGAVSGWMMKAGSTMAITASGFILVFTRFEESLGGAQPEGTLLKMRLLYIFIPLVCFIGTLIMGHMYPLTKQKMRTIRNELELRRGAVQ